MLSGKNVLVTGGTGSFGKKFIETILLQYPDVEKVVVFSRDELKQYEMSMMPIFQEYEAKIRYFIGNVRDLHRVKRAFEDIDVVIHAAALKQVPAAEYNPFECIKTNVLGAQNIIDAALDSNVQSVVALSTDKAAAPVNLYGATKLCSDKLFVAANNMKGRRNLKLSVVRYGNVLGSRGSVVPFFLGKKDSGSFPITDMEMTRFNITLNDGVEMVMHSLKNAWGGEIFIPKIPSYRIGELAEAISPTNELSLVGIRPGEKLHEEMITSSDSLNTVDCGNYYIILPSTPIWDVNEFLEKNNGRFVEKGFEYNSGTNTEWLGVEELRTLITEHVDPSFRVE
jgi:UDP-N-acetylglucosamine 4,6-dehydratase/5-epimerase